jgi:hypothetical protein
MTTARGYGLAVRSVPLRTLSADSCGYEICPPLFFLMCSLLAGCTTTGSNPVADMPSWMGGLPADAPPRPGTPAYEAWQAERAQEAARPKAKNAAH